ncbi:MAG: hypothetical protein GXO85_02445 [Chlorobi bacterium]|nr:hypothetical protein [Chlorobiota bacterium]
MKKLKFIMIIVSVLFFYSCQTVDQISTFNDLSELEQDDELQIITIDSTVYYADSFTYTDSTIKIIGTKNLRNEESNFIGELNFSDIAYIQAEGVSTWKTLGFIAATGVIVFNGVSYLDSRATLSPNLEIYYPHGGGYGSCPFIYSWNGTEFQLEGEAFGIALGKALETETHIVLPNLNSSNNKYKIKLTNERPETHFFNNICITAAEVGKDVIVYSDNKNKLQPVTKLRKIYDASDLKNTNLTKQLLNEDNLYWESDLSTANSDQNFEDQLFVNLKNISADADSISLMVSAINTDISSSVFQYLHTLLGDELANFTKAAETDKGLISILKETLNRSALKIDIWDGEKWQYNDLIYPEANFVKFNKLVRLPVVIHNGAMQIRLRCLTDVWKIDAIHFDDSPRKELTIFPVEITSFTTNSKGTLEEIKEKDDLYVKLLPGEEIELEFNSVKVSQNKKVVYTVTVGGYLYEWIIDKSLAVGEGLENLDTSTPRIELVKTLLRNMDAFLPIIYDNWKSSKQNVVLKN